MADPQTDRSFAEQVAGAVIFTACGLGLVSIGRRLLLKRGLGPILRWVYSEVPPLRSLVRISSGDLPLLHEEAAGLLTVGETAFTLGFWGAYMYITAVTDAVDEFMGFLGHVALYPIPTQATLDTLSELIPRFLAYGATGASVVRSERATSVSSGSGRIAIAMLNVWEVDP